MVSENGLVEVMRGMLEDPERYDWMSVRLEISKQLRTDPVFRAKWIDHQSVLDEAVRVRLSRNVDKGQMRTDVPIEVLHTFLETVLDGFISRLATGASTEGLSEVLDLVEGTVRKRD